MKALALFAGQLSRLGGCEIYRITMPLYALEKNSNKWMSAWMDTNNFVHMDSKLRGSSVSDTNIFLLPRHATDLTDKNKESVLNFINILKRTGGKVVYEVDDDLTNKYRKVPGGGENAMWVARQCDAITVSTPYLKPLMENISQKPAFVVPNSIDMETWNEELDEFRKLDGITIGLTGSSTHYMDWIVLTSIIKDILNDYPYTKFILGNFFPEYFDNLPEDRVERIPGLPYEKYRFLIRATDIVLAPVEPDDRFNDGKSAIKAIEGMASKRLLSNGKYGGAAVIATSNPVYRRAINNKSNGLLVEQTPESWDRAIRSLLDNQSLRETIQEKALKWVYKNRDISKTWKLWDKTYKKILEL